MIGNIVTVMTTTGEFVGKVVEYNTDVLELSDPRMIVTTESGMGFANGVAMTSGESPKEATFKDYIFVTPTNTQVADAWREHTSGIILNNQGIIGA